METETKHLRGIILSYQLWMERQIALGLLDIENTPKCFDRKRNSLQEMINEKTIGSHCSYCNLKFNVGEKKVTDNHVFFFHIGGCKDKYYKKEDESLNREDKY